jgi:hypothetical protein
LIVVSSRILDLLLLVEVDLGADFLGFFWVGQACEVVFGRNI